MKRLFHAIPPGSYNKMGTIEYFSGKTMRNKIPSIVLLALIVITLTVNTTGIQASPSLIVNSYYRPGDTVEITGTVNPGAEVVMDVRNSVKWNISDTTTADPSGEYVFTFQLEDDARPDVYKIMVSFDDSSENGVFRVTSISLEDITQSLLDMVIRAKNQVEATYERMKENDVEVPENARQHYLDGVDELDKARTSNEDGDAEEATAHLKAALNHFKTALNIVYRNTANQPPEVHEQARIKNRVRTKLQYVKTLLKKVPTTIQTLKRAGIDTSRLTAALELAEVEVSEIEELLANGELREAERRIDNLIEKIRQFNSYYSQYRDRIKTMLLTKYNENFQARIARLENTINKMEHLTPEKTETALTTLNTIKRNLNQVKDDIAEGKTDLALTQLRSQAQKLDTALSNLNGGVKNLLNSYDRVSTQVGIYNSTGGGGTDFVPDRDTSAQRAKDQLKNILSRLLSNRLSSTPPPKNPQQKDDTEINGQPSNQNQGNSTDTGSTSLSPTN